MQRSLDTAPTVEELLTITVSGPAPDTVLCVLHGDIDAATGPRLQCTLTDVARRAPAHLVIDLTNVEFMASIGLHILAQVHQKQRAAGHHLAVVVGYNYAVMRPLEVTGLDQSLDLHTEITSCGFFDLTGVRVERSA